jgi:hypothetical protein
MLDGAIPVRRTDPKQQKPSVNAGDSGTTAGSGKHQVIGPRSPGRPRTREDERANYFRGYQGRWLRERRDAWLRENGPCRACSSFERLEVDHVDRGAKVTHRLWSLSDEKRAAELAKCQVLCRRCHQDKTRRERYPLSESQVAEILRRLERGETCRAIGAEFGVGHNTVSRIARGNHPFASPPFCPPVSPEFCGRKPGEGRAL